MSDVQWRLSWEVRNMSTARYLLIKWSNYRIQGHFSPTHLHVSEAFVEQGILQWALLLLNYMQISYPVQCILQFSPLNKFMGKS